MTTVNNTLVGSVAVACIAVLGKDNKPVMGADGKEVTAPKFAIATKNMVSKATGESYGTRVTYISRKEFGQAKGLKGAKLDKAHKEYRRELGLDMNVGISGAMTRGEVIAQKVTPTSTGFNVSFVTADKVISATSASKTISSLKAELAAAQAATVAAEKAKAELEAFMAAK